MTLVDEESADIQRAEIRELCEKRSVFNNVRCIQEVGRYFRVTFDSVKAKDQFLSKGFEAFSCAPIDNSARVKVSRLPFEVPDSDLKALLGSYGETLFCDVELDEVDGLPTGTRILRIDLRKHLPNRLFLLGFPFRIWYPGQPKQCHHCSSEDHLVASCPERGLCRSCRKPGDMAKNCPQKNCGGTNGFSWGSTAPIVEVAKDNVVPQAPSSGQALDMDAPASTLAPSSGQVTENPINEKENNKVPDSLSEHTDDAVEVMDEGFSPAIPKPSVKEPSSETASPCGSVPARHPSSVIGAAADLAALEFSRHRVSASPLKAKSKVKPKRPKPQC